MAEPYERLGREIPYPGFNSDDIEVESYDPEADRPIYAVDGVPMKYEDMTYRAMGRIVSSAIEVGHIEEPAPRSHDHHSHPRVPTEYPSQSSFVMGGDNLG